MKKVLHVVFLVSLLFATMLGVAYAAPPQQTGQEYTVQADDWLSKLAEKNYGDVLAWPVIWKATQAKAAEDDSFAVIPDPNIIEVGQKLWIPDESEAAALLEQFAAERAAASVEGSADITGELNLLCVVDLEWCEGMVFEFNKLYPGIIINWVRMSSGESLTRLRNEASDPQFDVWWGGPVDSYIAAAKEGLLEPYDSPNAVNLRDPNLMKADDNSWFGIYVGSLGFATNTNYLAEHPEVQAPTSWAELIEPQWKGQILVAHPSSSGTSYTHLCTNIQLKGEEAWDYERALAANVLQFTKSGSAPARFVGAGEAAVAIVFSHDIVAQIEKGLPLKLTFPSEGTGYEIGGTALIKGAKHPDLAKLWIDWALTPAAQELGPKYSAYQAPTVIGAEPSKPELLDVKLIDYDFEFCGSNKKDIIDRFTNEIANAENLKQ
ncbi:MAG: extracellular solute-binding protein [Chloroflexi bacterium]|nr:MAG: extracellular solute-binding protein [Chloroflexota bacterium]